MVTIRRSRGMTLIEVMIALGITTIGLLGGLATMGSLFRGATFSRNVSEGMSLVQSKLETEVSRNITLVTPANGATVEAAMNEIGITTGSGPFNYTRTTTWALSADGLRRKVTVDVDFVDGGGGAHRVSAERERNVP